jgi:hypothetical protein
MNLELDGCTRRTYQLTPRGGSPLKGERVFFSGNLDLPPVGLEDHGYCLFDVPFRCWTSEAIKDFAANWRYPSVDGISRPKEAVSE